MAAAAARRSAASAGPPHARAARVRSPHRPLASAVRSAIALPPSGQRDAPRGKDTARPPVGVSSGGRNSRAQTRGPPCGARPLAGRAAGGAPVAAPFRATAGFVSGSRFFSTTNAAAWARLRSRSRR